MPTRAVPLPSIGINSAAETAPQVEPIVRYSAALQDAPRFAWVTTRAAKIAQYPSGRCHPA